MIKELAYNPVDCQFLEYVNLRKELYKEFLKINLASAIVESDINGKHFACFNQENQVIGGIRIHIKKEEIASMPLFSDTVGSDKLLEYFKQYSEFAEMSKLFTHADYQNQMIATKLWLKAKSYLETENIKYAFAIVLESQKDLYKHLYEKITKLPVEVIDSLNCKYQGYATALFKVTI